MCSLISSIKIQQNLERVSCFMWQKCSVMHILQKVTGHWAKIWGAAGISCLELICNWMVLIRSQLIDLEGWAVSFFYAKSWSREPRRYAQDKNILKAYDSALMEISCVFMNSFFEKLSFNKSKVKIWQCCFKRRSRECNIFHVLLLASDRGRTVYFNIFRSFYKIARNDY